MKWTKIKQCIKFGTLFLAISLLLINCQNDQNSFVDKTAISEKPDIEASMLNGKRLINENPVIQKILTNGDVSSSRNSGSKYGIYISKYEFTIDTTKVLRLAVPDYVSYTFEIHRDNHDTSALENYVLTVYPDNSVIQYLVKYPRLEGNSYDFDNKEFTYLDEENRLFGREGPTCNTVYEAQWEETDNCIDIPCQDVGAHPYGHTGCTTDEAHKALRICEGTWVEVAVGVDCGSNAGDTGGDTGNIGDNTDGGGTVGSVTSPVINYWSIVYSILDPMSQNEFVWMYIERDQVDNLGKFLGANPTNAQIEFAKRIAQILSDTSLTEDQQFDQFEDAYNTYDPILRSANPTDFEEKIRQYAEEFRRRGQTEFADYLKSIIPFDASTTIGEIIDVFELIKDQNLKMSFLYLKEIVTTTVVSFQPIIEMALMEVGGGFALKLLQKLPTKWLTTPVKNIITRLTSSTSNAFSSFKHAKKFGIETFATLEAKFIELGITRSGLNTQFHHLIEQRFKDIPAVRNWLGTSTKNWKSIVLTPQEHQIFTNAWKDAIARSNQITPGWTGAFTNTATLEQIKQAARQIYKNYPEILQALGL